MTRSEVFDHIKQILLSAFELDPAEVRESSRLVEDLDLDSIDAVDMFAELESLTGKRIDQEQGYGLRTVADVVELVLKNMTKGAG